MLHALQYTAPVSIHAGHSNSADPRWARASLNASSSWSGEVSPIKKPSEGSIRAQDLDALGDRYLAGNGKETRWQIGLREGLYQTFVSNSGSGDDGSSWHTCACENSLALVRARRSTDGPLAAELRYLEPWDTYAHFGNCAPKSRVYFGYPSHLNREVLGRLDRGLPRAGSYSVWYKHLIRITVVAWRSSGHWRTQKIGIKAYPSYTSQRSSYMLRNLPKRDVHELRGSLSDSW